MRFRRCGGTEQSLCCYREQARSHKGAATIKLGKHNSPQELTQSGLLLNSPW